MKKLIGVLILGLLALLYFTNPSSTQFSSFISRESRDRFSNNSTLGQIGNIVTDELESAEVNLLGTRDDYLFFSIHRYRGGGSNMREDVYLGVFNHFYSI